MHYLDSILGDPAVRVPHANDRCAGILTEKGFVICDPTVLDTGWQMPEADPGEWCQLRRGHIHLRIKLPPKLPLKRKPADPWGGLDLVSGWIVILPFQDLPEAARRILSRHFPENFTVPVSSVQPLRQVLEAWRMDARRQLRLRDALADAGYPSPVTLRPTGLHSSPVRIFGKNPFLPLPLPEGYRLSAILGNWSGQEEFVEFQNWPVAAAG